MGTETLYFNCPHCHEPIDLTVKADTSHLDYNDDYDEDLEDSDYGDEYRDRGWKRSDIPYFQTMDKVLESASEREAVPWIKAHLDTIPALIETESVNLTGFHVLDRANALRTLAWAGERAALEQVQEMAATLPMMTYLSRTVKSHIDDIDRISAIGTAVAENPGCEQPKVKEPISEPDGRRVAHLVEFMVRAGDLTRTREGRTIHLFPA